MSTDKVKVTPEAKELVRLAISTTPPTANEWQFRVAVRDRLATLATMMSEASVEATRAQKLLDSKYVKATLLSIEFEDSSNRWIVTVRGEESANEETETFRTERKETNLGKEHAARLADYIGVQCLFLLWLEPMTGSKIKNVRTLQHFIPQGQPTSRQSAQGGGHRTQSGRTANGTVPASVALLDDPRLNGQDKVTVARRLREELDVRNPMKIPNEHLDAARAFIEEAIAKRGEPVADPAEHFPGATYEGEG